jgi:signal transduction histidine kinase
MVHSTILRTLLPVRPFPDGSSHFENPPSGPGAGVNPTGKLLMGLVILVSLVSMGSVAAALGQAGSMGRAVIITGLMVLMLAVIIPGLHRHFVTLDLTGGARTSSDGHEFLMVIPAFITAVGAMLAAGETNPMGLQQWFWLPAIGASALNLRWSVTIGVVAAALVAQFLHLSQYYPLPANFARLAGQMAETGLVIACVAAISETERIRSRLRRMETELVCATRLVDEQAGTISQLAATAERARVSQEIHDAVGYALCSVGVQLQVAASYWEDSPALSRQSLEKAAAANQRGVAEMRQALSRRACPDRPIPFSSVLHDLAGQVETPGLRVHINCQDHGLILPPALHATLQRCVQEGLSNACRHSGASAVFLSLTLPVAGRIRFCLEDNGTGFPDRFPHLRGLAGLMERVRGLGGQMHTGRSSHGGACLKIDITY